MIMERRIRQSENTHQWFIEESVQEQARGIWKIAKVYYTEEDARSKLRTMR